jgi:hypothetical protein
MIHIVGTNRIRPDRAKESIAFLHSPIRSIPSIPIVRADDPMSFADRDRCVNTICIPSRDQDKCDVRADDPMSFADRDRCVNTISIPSRDQDECDVCADDPMSFADRDRCVDTISISSRDQDECDSSLRGVWLGGGE